MNSKRAEEIMRSHGVIHVSYNGMPVWIESVKGEDAEVTLIDMDKKINVSTSALAEADPMYTM